MKVQSILLAVALIFTSFSANAQGLLDGVRQTAEMHNESRGIDDSENSGLTAEQEEEYRQRWEDYMKEAQEKYEAELNGLGAYEKCYALMVIYLDQYYKLEKAIKRENNCKMKYDFYGMQLLAISAGNTILYCPEKISNLPDDMQLEAFRNFLDPYLNELINGNYQFWNSSSNLDEAIDFLYTVHNPSFGSRGSRITGVKGHSFAGFQKWIWEHFHPVMTVTKVLDIGQKMEALGCGG